MSSRRDRPPQREDVSDIKFNFMCRNQKCCHIFEIWGRELNITDHLICPMCEHDTAISQEERILNIDQVVQGRDRALKNLRSHE